MYPKNGADFLYFIIIATYFIETFCKKFRSQMLSFWNMFNLVYVSRFYWDFMMVHRDFRKLYSLWCHWGLVNSFCGVISFMVSLISFLILWEFNKIFTLDFTSSSRPFNFHAEIKLGRSYLKRWSHTSF